MHVKRFQQDMRGRLSKIDGAVPFPIHLNLTPFCDPKVLLFMHSHTNVPLTASSPLLITTSFVLCEPGVYVHCNFAIVCNCCGQCRKVQHNAYTA